MCKCVISLSLSVSLLSLSLPVSRLFLVDFYCLRMTYEFIFRIASLKVECPLQYAAYQACLDQNDFRVEGCLAAEAELINRWNQRND